MFEWCDNKENISALKKEKQSILKELKDFGLITKSINIEKGYTTSITVTLVRKDGERTFFTYAGQLEKIDRNFIFNSLDKIKSNSIIIFCSLFQYPNLEIIDVIDFFKELVIGKLPNENDLVDTLQKIAERLRLVHWEI